MKKDLSKLKQILSKNENICIPEPLTFTSTGFHALDKILGGGIPNGRFTELWGVPQSGKTTLALQIGVQVQKNGGTVLFYDVEHGFNKDMAMGLGLDVEDQNKFLYICPKEGSHSKDLDTIMEICREKLVDLVIIDSVANLLPEDVVEREMADREQASLAKFLKRFILKISDVIAEQDIPVIMINQITDDTQARYNTETTPGGHAPKFITYMRLRLAHTQYINSKYAPITSSDIAEQGYGDIVKAVAKKTRTTRPFQEAEMVIVFGKGFDHGYDEFQQMIVEGKVTKAGAWYMIGDKKFQGMENCMKYLNEVKNNGNTKQEV